MILTPKTPTTRRRRKPLGAEHADLGLTLLEPASRCNERPRLGEDLLLQPGMKVAFGKDLDLDT